MPCHVITTVQTPCYAPSMLTCDEPSLSRYSLVRVSESSPVCWPKITNMAYHRNHAQFERSHWRRSLLIPSWIIQSLIFVGIISICAYRLVWTLTRPNFGKDSAISSAEVM
jgi:hypothetical protein